MARTAVQWVRSQFDRFDNFSSRIPSSSSDLKRLPCQKKWQTMGTFKWRDMVAAVVKLDTNLFAVEL
ncbi:hypothetical protein TIFTF001_055154 [Ficus carica]|uniref:Uncharacterized protein n=1 Tax=Ficus carica TaxID=3494 RepID=A0AA88JGK6_FICCA|nr:hypothetical protein TIFTF001_055154 [Ficus carica]